MKHPCKQLKPLIILFFLVFTFGQCTPEVEKTAQPVNKLELETNADKQKFLQDLFELDQKVRSEINAKCQANFESYDCAKSRVDAASTDLENLRLISIYLDQYGYPSKQDFDEIPLITPWTILHHTVGAAPAVDRKYMPVLITAWEKGDLEAEKILWYLDRRYTLTNRVKEVEYPEDGMSEEQKVRYLIGLFMDDSKGAKLLEYHSVP